MKDNSRTCKNYPLNYRKLRVTLKRSLTKEFEKNRFSGNMSINQSVNPQREIFKGRLNVLSCVNLCFDNRILMQNIK